MPIQFSQNDDQARSAWIGREELIEVEIINLFFKQSHLGVAGTLINAGALMFLLRGQVNNRYLDAWFAVMLLVTTLRAVLIYQYGRREITLGQAKKWGRWNISGLAATGLLWAATMLIIFPSQSTIHQICLAFIICGIMTGSANLYAGMPLALKAFSVVPILFMIIRFLTFNDAMHLMIAGLGALYLVLMVFTSHNFARTNRQLMSAKIELAGRVTERTRALEAANLTLQNEMRERLKIEERLRQERDRLEIITTTIGAGLTVISKKYRTLWANRIFKETFGEVQGQPCYKSHYQRDRICEACGARMVFEQGCEKAVHEQQHLDVNGNSLWFQIVTTPIRNEEGRVRAVLELVLPITERKQAESARRRMAEQLEEARKTEAIATLAGGIAHQFNNALAVITGNIELMEQDYGHDPQFSAYSQPILDTSDRMAQLTNQLLAYAKGGKYKEQPNDLSAVTETTLNLIRHTIAPRICVNTLLDPDLPKVKIDVTQIQMVISAIVANASEAVTGSGLITISCFKVLITDDNCSKYGNIPPGEYVALSVLDNGAGMDDRTLKRIFEPFFTTKFQGRGLGMAAVYGIIKNHGGYIDVTSNAGKGSEVCVCFPASEGVAHSLSPDN